MHLLNNDCLIEIIKHLSLKDQISVYQVSSSLQVAVTTHWLVKFKHIRINFIEVSLTNEEFAILLRTLQGSLKVLHLRFLNKEKYQVLKELRFEHVTDFRFTLAKPYFLEDDDLKDLKKVVPNLTAFSPHGNLTGLNMDEWPLLKDLNLSFCFKLKKPHFINVLSRLKLEKLKLDIFISEFDYEDLQDAHVADLKYLRLNVYEFNFFLTKPLTSLKELTLTNLPNLGQVFNLLLVYWKAKDFLCVETANIDNILTNCIETHMNVEQLCIINDEKALPAEVIGSLYQLTELRKLRFKNCYIFVKDFIDLLQNIPQLHELSFENCYFDEANICLQVENVCMNRKEKLRLNMFENRLMDNLDRPTWCREMLEEVRKFSILFNNTKK